MQELRKDVDSMLLCLFVFGIVGWFIKYLYEMDKQPYFKVPVYKTYYRNVYGMSPDVHKKVGEKVVKNEKYFKYNPYGNELTRKLKMEYLNEQVQKEPANKEYEQSKKEYEQYIKEKQYKEMYNEMEDWDI